MVPSAPALPSLPTLPQLPPSLDFPAPSPPAPDFSAPLPSIPVVPGPLPPSFPPPSPSRPASPSPVQPAPISPDGRPAPPASAAELAQWVGEWACSGAGGRRGLLMILERDGGWLLQGRGAQADFLVLGRWFSTGKGAVFASGRRQALGGAPRPGGLVAQEFRPLGAGRLQGVAGAFHPLDCQRR